jgi:hypothetical protein
MALAHRPSPSKILIRAASCGEEKRLKVRRKPMDYRKMGESLQELL